MERCQSEKPSNSCTGVMEQMKFKALVQVQFQHQMLTCQSAKLSLNKNEPIWERKVFNIHHILWICRKAEESARSRKCWTGNLKEQWVGTQPCIIHWKTLAFVSILFLSFSALAPVWYLLSSWMDRWFSSGYDRFDQSVIWRESFRQVAIDFWLQLWFVSVEELVTSVTSWEAEYLCKIHFCGPRQLISLWRVSLELIPTAGRATISNE